MRRDKLQGAPLRVDPAKLAGTGLQEIPVAVANPVGNPRRIVVPTERKPRVSVVFQGDVIVIVYESSPGKSELEDYGYDEFIHVLEGKLILTPTGAAPMEREPMEIEAGGDVVLPRGFSGTWEMVGDPYRELVVMEYETWRAAELPAS